MKNLNLLFLILAIAIQGFAQSTHTIDFEANGTGVGWEWIVQGNGDNPPIEFIDNPVNGGINSSPKVAKFTARLSGEIYAYTHTIDDGQFTFDADNHIFRVMVYKPVISPVAIKFDGPDQNAEIQATNTQINQWEELEFDFSGFIGNTYNRFRILPDCAPRNEDHIIYLDNIQMPDGEVVIQSEPTTAPPVPQHAEIDVISIYTEVYPNAPNTIFNPNWGQATQVTIDYPVAGNNTLKYDYLDYQGTQFANLNVSTFQFLHVDFWTSNATSLDFYLISPGAETFYSLPITTETWVSVDIPLSYYVPPVNLANIFQFKVFGNGIIYFDNWYFWKEPYGQGYDPTLSDLKIDGESVPGFSSNVLTYDVDLPYGTSEVPTTIAVTTDPQASFVINDAISLPGTTTIVVTSANGSNTLTYTINFAIDGPEPQVAAPDPTEPSEDVISIYSDVYQNIEGVNFNPNWLQQTIVTVDYPIAGNNTLKYKNLNYQGTEFPSQDVSGYDFFHLDFWTSNSNELGFILISSGQLGWGFSLDITPETWVSVDIPMDYFEPHINLSDLIQFMVEGNGDVWFDNWYFWRNPTWIETFDNTSKPLSIFPNPATDFISISQEMNLVNLEIFNITGQKVKQISTVPLQIPVNDLQHGVYTIIAIDIHGQQFTDKLLIK